MLYIVCRANFVCIVNVSHEPFYSLAYRVLSFILNLTVRPFTIWLVGSNFIRRQVMNFVI